LDGLEEPVEDPHERLAVARADKHRHSNKNTQTHTRATYDRLGCLDGLEELIEDPHERLIVTRAEDLGDKGAALTQELRRKLQ
jgi:hypothetical protein